MEVGSPVDGTLPVVVRNPTEEPFSLHYEDGHSLGVMEAEIDGDWVEITPYYQLDRWCGNNDGVHVVDPGESLEFDLAHSGDGEETQLRVRLRWGTLRSAPFPGRAPRLPGSSLDDRASAAEYPGAAERIADEPDLVGQLPPWQQRQLVVTLANDPLTMAAARQAFLRDPSHPLFFDVLKALGTHLSDAEIEILEAHLPTQAKNIELALIEAGAMERP